jgi:hypothetical protein
MKNIHLLSIALIFLGCLLYYCMIQGNDPAIVRLFFGEMGSVVIFIGSVSLLKSVKD